jgi:hypothetical protein
MHPENVKRGFVFVSTQPFKNAVVEWPSYADRGVVAKSRKKFVVISVKKRDVPLDPDSTETLVLVASHRKIRTIEYGQINVGLLRNASQQGCLILNGMTYQISKFYFFGHVFPSSVIEEDASVCLHGINTANYKKLV